VTINSSSVETYVPEKISARQAFTQYLDLLCAPTRSLLRAFLAVANAEGNAKLSPLLETDHEQELTEYFGTKTCADVICELVQYGIPSLSALLSACVAITQRTYSLTSSSHQRKGGMQIIVEKHLFGENNQRVGLASGFLTRPNLQKICVKVSGPVLSAPDEAEGDLVIIAMGIGITSVLGIIESHEANSTRLLLVYSCPSKANYGPLCEILEGLKTSGKITDIILAFATGDDLITPIQEAMKAIPQLVWSYWADQKAALLFSGSTAGGEEIRNTLSDISIQEGHVDESEAPLFTELHPNFVHLYDAEEPPEL
jgi:sulfite reductase alpha subunit-like flavoprotein